MQADDLERRFSFHPRDDDNTKRLQEGVHQAFHDLANEIDLIGPDGREKSLAVTKLEEAMMWVDAMIERSDGPS